MTFFQKWLSNLDKNFLLFVRLAVHWDTFIRFRSPSHSSLFKSKCGIFLIGMHKVDGNWWRVWAKVEEAGLGSRLMGVIMNYNRLNKVLKTALHSQFYCFSVYWQKLIWIMEIRRCFRNFFEAHWETNKSEGGWLLLLLFASLKNNLCIKLV